MNTKKLSILAMFTTIALIIFTIESAIPPLIPIPGIKLGLANIVTLILLRNSHPSDAFCVLFMRILLSSFFLAQAISLFYSLVGGCLCFAAMFLVNRLLHSQYLFLTSMVGGVFHNLGQLFVAFLITQVPGVVVYLPFLIISGVITGLFTGLCAQFCQTHISPFMKWK